MLIQSRLYREGGFHVILGEETYEFAPNKDGVLVCEVKDKAHIKVLLSIPEGYHEYGKPPSPVPSPPTAPPARDSDDEAAAGGDSDTEVDPEKMSNKALDDWATDRGINPKDKNSIEDYGVQTFDVDLNKAMSPANMIRELVKQENAKVEEGAG